MKRVFTAAFMLTSAVGLAGCVGGSASMAPSAAATMSSSGSAGSSSGSGSSFPTAVASARSYQSNAVDDASFEKLINGVRRKAGADPVSYNGKLNRAAQNHAKDMLKHDYFSHTSRDGRSLSDRVTATGYKWRKVGENIGMGQTSEKEVLTGWVGSPGHQKNNIDPDFEEFGLGRAGSGADTRWVLVFGDPAE